MAMVNLLTVEQATKRCRNCDEIKPIADFHVDRRNQTDGRQTRCKPCLSNQMPNLLPKEVMACPKCKEIRPLTWFHKDVTVEGGRRPFCRLCKGPPKPEPEVLPAGMKRCVRCKDIKMVNDFYLVTSRKIKHLQGKCKKCSIERANQWNKKHPERCYIRTRVRNLKKYGGITIEKWGELIASQNNKCCICKRQFGKTKHFMAVPHHDHTLGHFVSAVCGRCNKVEGLLENYATALAMAGFMHKNELFEK